MGLLLKEYGHNPGVFASGPKYQYCEQRELGFLAGTWHPSISCMAK
jgi:hypothetical protein